jgi:hypothetical protein
MKKKLGLDRCADGIAHCPFVAQGEQEWLC